MCSYSEKYNAIWDHISIVPFISFLFYQDVPVMIHNSWSSVVDHLRSYETLVNWIIHIHIAETIC